MTCGSESTSRRGRSGRRAAAGSSLLVLVAALGACSATARGGVTQESAEISKAAGSAALPLTVNATFRIYQGPTTIAATYDRTQVPLGAKAKIDVMVAGKATEVTMQVTGLQPDRSYGAHLHKASCGAKPADAGSHYQNVADPHQPSTDPRFANPNNEVWLDVMTDAQGSARSKAVVPFVFRAGGEGPHSLVIHAMKTMHAAGKAGTAGARLACVDLPG
jgi:Cu-Zn family superoxide dismutase